MKYKIFTVIALLGSTVAELFGGWDTALKTLLIFMVLDWLTGGIILPAVFRKSPKSPNGALESRAGWKGLCRKGMTLLYVLIAARLDMVLGVEYIRNAVCIGFIANEVTFYCGECRADGSSYAFHDKKGSRYIKGHSRKWSEVVWGIYQVIKSDRGIEGNREKQEKKYQNKNFINKYSSVRFIGLTQTYVSYRMYTNKCLYIRKEAVIYILLYRRKI